MTQQTPETPSGTPALWRLWERYDEAQAELVAMRARMDATNDSRITPEHRRITRLHEEAEEAIDAAIRMEERSKVDQLLEAARAVVETGGHRIEVALLEFAIAAFDVEKEQ